MDKIILITGAGSGIGYDTACRFLTEGDTVIGCDRSESGLITLQEFAEEHDARFHSLVLDLAEADAPDRAEAAVGEFGRLDVLVNCAGICSGTTIGEMTPEEWDRTYAVNVKGPFFLTQRLLTYLSRGKDATIINISSMAGFTGGIKSSPAYSSSKAAVTCMTKNLAKYCAPIGIRVNEVSPGTAVTPMTQDWLGEDGLKHFAESVPMGRLAEPADVGRVIVFLASEQAGFITGQCIQVNGGMYIP